MLRDAERRRYWVGASLVCLFGLAALSQARVHWFGRVDILSRAKDTQRYIVSRTDYARRGTISSADGVALAQSEDGFELSVNLRRVPATDSFFLALAEAANVSASELAAAAGRQSPSIAWRRRLNPDEAARVQRVKEEWRADGVSLGRVLRRTYPLSESAAGVVGEVENGKPVAGLELSKDVTLAGQDGYREGLIDRTGAFLPMRMTQRSTRRLDGQNMTLTLVSSLQVEATLRLRQAVEANKADSGMAIVMDPRTGNILAMANWPSYDPGSEGTGANLNPLTGGVYEPGSTFKILTLAAALENGKTTTNNIIYCPGHLDFKRGPSIHCPEHKGVRAHGQVNANKAIAQSCNVAAATWALRVGRKGMEQFIRQLGVLDKPDLGLPMEVAGLYNWDSPAPVLQTATVGFGQSLSCTPLALASGFCMLANDGVRMNARLVSAIDGREQPTLPGRRVVRADVANTVMHLMKSVIDDDHGTGRSLRLPGYELAGKTGTAQKLGGGTKGYVSNFVGFVPADQPKAMILVMVDNPKAGKYFGGEVAGPVFRDLARAVIRTYQIPPTRAAGTLRPATPAPNNRRLAPKSDAAGGRA